MSTIGSKTLAKGDRKYFYKITRNNDNDLISSVVQINFDSQNEVVVLNDPTVESAESQHVFQGFETNYTYVNIDANRELIDQPLGVTQYKVRNEKITYFVNDDGNLIARLST